MSQHQSPATDISTVFVQLSRLLHDKRPLTDTLQDVVTLAKRVIPGTQDVSVTMLTGERAQTVVFTGPLAVELDERQYDAGFGPCMDAARGGRTVQVDTAGSTTYPEFARLSNAAGVSHVVSLPLSIPGRSVGALNTYVALTRDLTEADVEVAQAFATYAAVALANSTMARGTGHLDEQVQGALRSRTVSEQAMSILMASRQCPAEAAFDAMVELSRQHGRPLREIAQSIVDGVDYDQGSASPLS